ncbi:hypothetical protein ACRYSL_22150 [Enterobacter mori]|uniref:hypothetical protein n=1 Tax=Enterobacter mori TaxID=539813 RepID=UPI001ED9D14F|nr:hypothetical protein [Enterobacter mori]UKJ21430.1 hypothetical protein L6Y89_22355 [Enterobacter mori]
MNIVSLFKNEHKVNIVFFVASYIITVFSLSLITVITVIIINYINRHSLVFDIGFAIKIIKMLSIAGLFAFIWSAICIYNDKKKCTKCASDLMRQYNKFNVNPDSEKKAESIRHIIKTMDMSRHLYGLMSGLIVNNIDTRVKGINIKEISYYLSCEVEYKTGEKDRFKLKFSAINGGDPVLKSISF